MFINYKREIDLCALAVARLNLLTASFKCLSWRKCNV